MLFACVVGSLNVDYLTASQPCEAQTMIAVMSEKAEALQPTEQWNHLPRAHTKSGGNIKTSGDSRAHHAAWAE